MDIIIQSLGFTASENLEVFINERMSKIENYGKIIRANVKLFQGSKRDSNDNYCEIRLEIPGNDLFVKKNNQSFETAVMEAIEALQHIMIKEKEKRIDKRRGG
ncbi:MAG TPA: HPF/RaiA family ribosome-associated protein [Chitinophagales bacterium]|nr:HPF/RaiA family ribosome-associated protein [Chitinophagales bacterium]